MTHGTIRDVSEGMRRILGTLRGVSCDLRGVSSDFSRSQGVPGSLMKIRKSFKGVSGAFQEISVDFSEF